VYLAGLAAPGSSFELAGVLARGSERSHACARRYGVPLYRDPDELPDGIDVACVVVPSSIAGGRGAELALRLMDRGMHVLQEHPVHAGELAACLRRAQAAGVHYAVNTHHVHVAPVKEFVAVARSLLRDQPPLFVDATTSFQVLYTLLDILGAVLGRLRPWGFAAWRGPGEDVRALTPLDFPYRSIEGVLGGVPATIRVQHQVDQREPDNYAHVWHRVTIGTEGGNLTLVNSAGPVIWCPRPHMPRSAAGESGFDRLDDAHLSFASAAAIGRPDGPAWTDVLDVLWPQAVHAAVEGLWDGVRRGAAPSASGQYHLALADLAREVGERLGPVEVVDRAPPTILSAGEVAGRRGSRQGSIA
jgi:thiazolinyl imide reductase